jgi:hypothetical protein
MDGLLPGNAPEGGSLQGERLTARQRALFLENAKAEATCQVEAAKYLGLWLHARRRLGYRYPSLVEQGQFFEVAREYAKQFLPTPKDGWVDEW